MRTRDAQTEASGRSRANGNHCRRVNGVPRFRIWRDRSARRWRDTGTVLCLTLVWVAAASDVRSTEVGLYKNGQKLVGFDQPALSPQMRLTESSIGVDQTQTTRRGPLAEIDNRSLFAAQDEYFRVVLACRDLVAETPGDGSLPSTDVLEQLALQADRVAAGNQALLTRFGALGDDLADRGIPEDKLTLHEDMVRTHARLASRLLELLGGVRAAVAAGDQATAAGAVRSLQDYFRDNIIAPEPQEASSQPAPVMIKPLAPAVVQRNALPAGTSAIAASAAEPPMFAPPDLSETIDVKFTGEISALASVLGHSAPAIYEYVHNNLTFEAYLGSRKGAAQTLEHMRGNDYDLASLLIALLRVSGIPSRYVKGVVEMPVTAATNWLGIDDITNAATVLHTAGFQVTVVYDGPTPVALRCTRVWVEAYVPYINYRGAVNDSTGFLWIPLDPAFKRYKTTTAYDLPAEIGFDGAMFVEDFWSTFVPVPPVEVFKQMLLDSLSVRHPGAAYGDLIRSRTVVRETDGILPGTLPYTLISSDGSFSAIPANMRYTIRFHLHTGATTHINYTTSLPEIVQKQVTISYVGATAADQQIIDDAGGIFHVPTPYLVNLKPVLKIDGCEVARGANAIMMGTTHSSDMHFTAPTGVGNQVPVIYNSIIAGNYQGIGIDTEDAYPADLDSVHTGCAEDDLGKDLHQTALIYLNNVDRAGDEAAALMHMVVTSDVSEAIVENTVRVLFSGIYPVSFTWTGMIVDADRKIVGPYSVDGIDKSYDYMRLAGADGSIQENRLFETTFAEEAVSTMKILQLASDSGIPICEITTSIAANCPGINQPSSVVTAINNALAAGHHVIIPKRGFQYHEWTGTGWIDLEPSTGAAGYLISGAHSGGATVQQWWISYPDMECDNPIGPVEVTPSTATDLYCSLSEEKWTFTVPVMEYWGLDENGECQLLGSERRDFPVRYTIKEIAERWGPGKYTFRAGTPGICGCVPIEKNVTIVKIDLIIHRPPVIDPAEAEIAEDQELAKGAQTFANLDNDDQDDRYDYGTNDGTVTGENEMCKLHLDIYPSDLSLGTVKLEAIAGVTNIRVWTTNEKTTEYVLGTTLTVPGDFTVVGNRLSKDLWVEGITAHTAQRGTVLKESYSILPNCGDNVALTVIGIDAISWVGQNNSVNDNNALDADPNWPAGLVPAAMRVFPDARHAGTTIEANPRNVVTARATLTVAPVEPVEISFKSFDTDDPTAADLPLDNENVSFDNRGLVPVHEGAFPDALIGILSVEFDAQTEDFGFRVTMQPGDNFRIAGNGDIQFLVDLENDDDTLGTNNADKQRITNKYMYGSGGPAQWEIRRPDHYASPVLVVWWKAHIEFDSMDDVANNFIDGIITDFDVSGSSAATTMVYVTENLRDSSADLDIGPKGLGNGRFESGTLRVANTHNISSLLGNGEDRLEKAAGINVCATPIPFSAVDNDWFGASTMSGTVTLIDNGARRLTLNVTAHSETPIDWPDFVGGTIRIGTGPTMGITATNGATSRVTVAVLSIPYRLTDDDSPDGWDVPDPDLTVATTAFAPAYVLPVQDLGSHQGSTTFIANLASDDAADVRQGWHFDWATDEALDRFWVVYVRGAFQHTTDSDNDPDAEGMTLGIVDDLGPPWGRGQGANVFMEWFQGTEGFVANPAQGRSEGHSLAHEIGHIFGGTHGDCVPPDAAPCASAGLMAQTSIRNSPDFSPQSLNRFRSIDHP